MKTLRICQSFLEGFECVRDLGDGHIRLAEILPAFPAPSVRALICEP